MTLRTYTLSDLRLLTAPLGREEPLETFSSRRKTPSEDIWAAHRLIGLCLNQNEYELQPDLAFDILTDSKITYYSGNMINHDLTPDPTTHCSRFRTRLDWDLLQVQEEFFQIETKKIETQSKPLKIIAKEIASVAAFYDSEHKSAPLTRKHHFIIRANFADGEWKRDYVIVAPNNDATICKVVNEKFLHPLPPRYWTYLGYK